MREGNNSGEQGGPKRRGVEEAERERATAENARGYALMILGHIAAIAHADQPDYPPLRECQARSRDLHRAISEAPWSALPPDTNALADGTHSFAMLLKLVEGLEELDDAQWDTVAESFGKPLALAA
ncbi:MAG: hypothetical protein ACE5MM_06650, partial [Nitrospiraceae bacterium]